MTDDSKGHASQELRLLRRILELYQDGVVRALLSPQDRLASGRRPLTSDETAAAEALLESGDWRREPLAGLGIQPAVRLLMRIIEPPEDVGRSQGIRPLKATFSSGSLEARLSKMRIGTRGIRCDLKVRLKWDEPPPMSTFQYISWEGIEEVTDDTGAEYVSYQPRSRGVGGTAKSNGRQGTQWLTQYWWPAPLFEARYLHLALSPYVKVRRLSAGSPLQVVREVELDTTHFTIQLRR